MLLLVMCLNVRRENADQKLDSFDLTVIFRVWLTNVQSVFMSQANVTRFHPEESAENRVSFAGKQNSPSQRMKRCKLKSQSRNRIRRLRR